MHAKEQPGAIVEQMRVGSTRVSVKRTQEQQYSSSSGRKRGGTGVARELEAEDAVQLPYLPQESVDRLERRAGVQTYG